MDRRELTKVGAAALALSVIAGVVAAEPSVVEERPGYNSWPMIQAVGDRLVCVYSRGTKHDVFEGVRGAWAKWSADGGKTWSEPVRVADAPDYGEVPIGKGVDDTGAALFWIRAYGGPKPHHDLYRTVDGTSFERIATPDLSPLPVQITDIFRVPGRGLVALWFAGNYHETDAHKCWGEIVSTDNGRTWTQRTIAKDLAKDRWPTEPSVVRLSDGRLLCIARSERYQPEKALQWQLESTDGGLTWSCSETNIRDVMASTPSLILDDRRNIVYNYYYERGKGGLKSRRAHSADVWGKPLAWPEPTVIVRGSDAPWDSGNANATLLKGVHYIAYYTGKHPNTSVVVVAVDPDAQGAKCVWAEGRQAESNLTVSFRTPFEWKGGAAPVCRIAAATVYRAFLNGEFVSWGPARTVGGFACIDEFKLAPKPGRNVLTVEVAGYNVSSYQYSGDKSFLCAEVVQDGTPLAATPSAFEAVETPRAKTGPVYSRQRGFVAEGYEIDRDWVRWTAGEKSARPRLKLAVVPSPNWRPRASARPTFRMNTSFLAEKEHWTLSSVDSGFIGLTFRCLKPGKISVEFDEALDKDGRIDLGRNGDPLSSWHAMLNRITWDVKEPGEYCVETMEPYTMRYVRTVTDGGAFEDVRPTLRQCRNPGMEKAAFDCSDPELNRLFAAAKESVAQNAVDIFTDCPSRERVGWLCDTYFTANAAAWLSGDFAIEREYLLNFTLTDDFGPNIPKGAIPGFMPSRSGGLMPTYAMWYVVQCVQAASRLEPSARQAFVDRVRGRIEGILGYLAGFEREGLLEDLPGWVFIEWSKANDYVKGVNFPANMMWAFALDRAGALFDRKDLREKAAAVRNRTLELSMKDGRFHDQALRGADGRLKLNDAASTEACQYYAFFTDLVSPSSHPKLWRTLVDEVGPGRRGHPEMDVADAFIGWMLRCELLARYGESKELYRSIKSYYGRMAETSGTLWEFADGHDSRCHAFAGNIAALIFREAFGIERIDWAKRTVSWREPSTALASAHGRIPVPGGEIAVTVTCENGRPIRKFSLPDGWR